VRSAGSQQIVDSVDAVLAALRPQADRDWKVPAGRLDWSCLETGAHIAHVLTKYASQLAGGRVDPYLPFDVVVRPQATAADVLDVVDACGRLLAAVVAGADPAARAWHYGMAAPDAFAAMGIGEVLVHGHDIAGGLGLDWRPPGELAAVVVRRLFANGPEGDPTDVLLWATARGELPGEHPVIDWVWTAATPPG